MNATGTGEAAVRLCAVCGMCCNGMLFHSVTLQPGDSARELAALGLKVKRRKACIPQPCPAHQESCCAIYAQRPARCRLFVCRQLEDVASGAVCESAALEKIRMATSRGEGVRQLFRQAGDFREHKTFATRYESIFAPPLDPSPHAARLRNELASAMKDFEQLLAKNFRIDGPATPESQAVDTG